jgi:hypothetical protein
MPLGGGAGLSFIPCGLECNLQDRKRGVCTLAHIKTRLRASHEGTPVAIDRAQQLAHGLRVGQGRVASP